MFFRGSPLVDDNFVLSAFLSWHLSYLTLVIRKFSADFFHEPRTASERLIKRQQRQ